MINKENLEKMMFRYSERGELSTKELNVMGFVSGDLTKMINDLDILTRERHGHYSVNSLKLFQEAMKAYDEGNFEFSYKVLYRCYINNQDEEKYIYYLFLFSILVKEYDVTFECLNKLQMISSTLYRKEDINFYLYMLSLVTKRSLEFELGEVKSMRYEDVDSKNDKFRLNVFNGRFKNIIVPVEFASIEERVQYFMLDIIKENQRQEKIIMRRLVLQKRYEELLDHFDNNLSYRNLDFYERQIYSLVQSYFKIKTGKKLPILRNLDSNDVIKSIQANNFKRALYLQDKYCENKNIDKNNDVLFILLSDISLLIDEINGLVKEDKEFKKEIGLEQKDNKDNFVKEDYVQNILELLTLNKVEDAINLISDYLSDNKEYIYLVNYLVKVSIYESDRSFSKPLMAIAMIKSGNFKFVPSEYILSFYEMLAKRKFECAGVYLDILDKAEEMGQVKITIDGMRSVLDNAIRESKDELKRPNYDFVSESSKDYSEKLKTLKEKGVVVLDYKEDETIEEVEMFNSLNCVDAFLISYKGTLKLVLRYKSNELISHEEIVSLINKANMMYVLGNYEEAFLVYRDIFSKTIISSSLCARIGDICVKLNRRKEAIDYYMIANSLKDVENIELRYSEVIDVLSGKDEITQDKSENKKIKIDKSLSFFDIDISQVIDLVNDNVSLEDACKILGLRKDEYHKCALLIAREYYYRGDLKRGDMYFKIVTRAHKKTEEVKSL